MKIAIVAPSPIPFNPGGAEAVWAGLYRQLGALGHDVELVKVPIRETTLPEVMAAYEVFSKLDLRHFDLVVTGKYPAWMVRHPRHVVYMLHPLRGLYDSYHHFGLPLTVEAPAPPVRQLMSRAASLSRDRVDTLFDDWHRALDLLGPEHPQLTFPGPLARLLVRALDKTALHRSQVSRYLAISRTVAGREGYFPRDADVEVVYPPSDLEGLHVGEGEYFFTASRHDVPKRLDALVTGMRSYRGRTRLVIAGEGPQTPELRRLADGDPRVEFVGRVSPQQLVDHYAHAIGVPFIPVDEDLGLITIEAMASGKPVLTATDSGGPTEFVVDGQNGIIVAPRPEAIGAGLERLERLARSTHVKRRALEAVDGISWLGAAEAVLGHPRRQDAASAADVRGGGSRPRLVVTSTFPVWPPRNGGQLRAYHLYRALGRWYDVHLVAQAPSSLPTANREIAPGLIEHVVPRTRAHEAAEAEITGQVGVPVTDVVAGRTSNLTPRYAATLAGLMEGAAGVLLADPYLQPVVSALNDRRIPVIYDAYNCEYVLKSQIFPPTAEGRALVAEVEAVERAAVSESGLIVAVSSEDRDAMIRLYGVSRSRFVLGPNGVDTHAIPFTAAAVRARNREQFLSSLRARGAGGSINHLAMFVGSWHVPNNNAAREIVRIAREMTDVGFVLLGSHVASLTPRNLPRNVIPLGVVTDAVKRSVLASSDVALAPLMEGSGTNLKVVEYLAAGIPTVSTTIGARGLDVGPNVLTIAKLADFRDAIRTVLLGADEIEQRALAGRLAVEDRYDWTAIADHVRHRIEATLVISR